MWQPISIEELLINIKKYEINLKNEQLKFWHLIKIQPKKWQEKTYGSEGGGFWVVGVCGQQIIWYNDIEEGFNISNYSNYGEIAEYGCDQNEIDIAVKMLWNASG